MACSCNSSAPTAPTSPQGCTGSLPLPRRSATPPIVPFTIRGIGSARRALSGKLLLEGCNDEVNILDSALNGHLVFDAETGTVTVAPVDSASIVQDNFPCSEQGIAGLFVMAKAPVCTEFGENPDREMVVARPEFSTKGMMLGFLPTCPTNLGQASEMIPVKIAPGALPGVLPTGLKTLVVREVVSEGCTPSGTYEFYASDQPVPVSADNLVDFDIPDRDLEEADDASFGLAILVKTSQGWVIQKVTNESLQAVFGNNNVNTVSYLSPRTVIYSQSVPAPGSIQAGSTSVNLTLQPNYFETAKEVTLHIFSVLLRNTGGFIIEIFINGVKKYLATSSTDAGTQDNGEITVPIPPNKTLDITVNKILGSAGNSDGSSGSSIDIYLESFR